MSTPALVALVTAGSAGLGAATARLFAREGFRVVVNYHSNAKRADALVAELRELSALTPAEARRDGFAAIRADLGDREELRQLVAETVTAMGRLDVVFSNGGWTRFSNFMDLEDNVVEEDWDRCFNMNVKSHLFLMHAAKEHLEKTKGSFITTASVAGTKPSGSSLVCGDDATYVHILVHWLITIPYPSYRRTA
jgi:NAD(P)-dependent dehydrogenase (short-subunit alcohol dehydrogenase family)